MSYWETFLVCLVCGILVGGAEPAILYLRALSLKWSVKFPWGTSAMRSREETLHSQRQILLLSGCLEWKPLCSSGMVWRFLLWVNGGKHSSYLRGLCGFTKVNAWTWCKWWHFISDAVCVSKAKHGGVCRGKMNMIKGRRVSWKQFWKRKNMFPATASSIKS